MGDVRSAVAKREEEAEQRQRNAAKFLESLGPQIRRVLPRHIPEDRLVRVAITACRRTPKLTECSPLSMAGAMLTAATLGLEPNTPTGECYLVPYKGEATLIVGYQGFAKLFWQSPLAAGLDAQPVYPEDDFDYDFGTAPFLRHKKGRRVKGSEPTDYYAVARLSTGASAFVVLSAEEVRELRGGKEGPSGDIPDPQRWMERKTAVRQLVKLLPKAPTLAFAAQVDEKGGTELYKQAQVERDAITAGAQAQIGPGEDGVDTATGEVVTGIVEDPPNAPWLGFAEPAGQAGGEER